MRPKCLVYNLNKVDTFQNILALYTTHLYTWVERSTVRIKCIVQEYNTRSPARARTRTARSRDERANHEAIVASHNYKVTVSDCTERGRHLEEIVAFILRNIDSGSRFL